MKQLSFTLTESYIELIKLLKYMGIADNGADAKMLVDQGEVSCNGQVETRNRYKVKAGDIISCSNTEIRIS